VVSGNAVRVFIVQVVVAGFDVLDADFPGLLGFLAPCSIRPTPPIDATLQMFDADGFSHGIGFLGSRHLVFVVPDVLSRLAFFKEQQIGAYAGVRLEDAVGQADDGVQVALFQQMFLEAGFNTFTE
jgi:hypothetical protein